MDQDSITMDQLGKNMIDGSKRQFISGEHSVIVDRFCGILDGLSVHAQVNHASISSDGSGKRFGSIRSNLMARGAGDWSNSTTKDTLGESFAGSIDVISCLTNCQGQQILMEYLFNPLARRLHWGF
jgi:hypothetical protein